MQKIIFDRPALRWEEVLPIGNGSLGGMIWGNQTKERIGLNLDTLWSGYYRDKNNPHAREHLEETRELIFAGDYAKAAKNVEKHLLGEFTENYLPMGDLFILSEHKTNKEIKKYRRELDLEEALAKVTYEIEGRKYIREYFASYPDHAILIRYQSEEPIDLTLSFSSELVHTAAAEAGKISIKGRCPEHVDPSYIDSKNPIIQGTRGLKFGAEIEILKTDGTILETDGTVLIQGACIMEAAVRAASGTRKQNVVPAFTPIDKTFEEMLRIHKKDYNALFGRVSLYLGEQGEEPTYKRIQALREGKEDPALYALFFQYGRYLLLSSSREGSEAANLQGIWNWEMRAPWSSNYTTNINVEMNYWPAEACNLSECMEPYFRLLRELVLEGRKTAQVHFGCRGFCVGHNTDYWRNTNPVGIRYGEKEGVCGSSLYAFFMLSGQWMCQALYRHYEYTKDKQFLKETAYPILRESALFCVDYLVEYEGYYVTCPSTSPENLFRTPDGTGTSPVSMGTTIDMTIIRETFEDFKKTCNELSIEDELLLEIKEREEHLPPYKIKADGRLQEWYYDFEEEEPGHRHISHAYGLFPGELFGRDKALEEACKKTIEYRLAHGGGHTGWSCAWIVSLFAVLHDSDNAAKYLKVLLTKSTENNLWTSHPPFQIDANFAGTMAICNMLLEDRNGTLSFLPALPKEWKDGYVKGLRIKGGRVADLYWKNGELIKQNIHE